MPKLTIYVPDDLWSAMCTLDAETDRPNWSAIAQVAFRTVIEERKLFDMIITETPRTLGGYREWTYRKAIGKGQRQRVVRLPDTYAGRGSNHRLNRLPGDALARLIVQGAENKIIRERLEPDQDHVLMLHAPIDFDERTGEPMPADPM